MKMHYNEQLVRQDGQELTLDILEAAENLWIKEAQELLVEHMEMGKLTRLCPRWLDGKILVGCRSKTVMKSNWNKKNLFCSHINTNFHV